MSINASGVATGERRQVPSPHLDARVGVTALPLPPRLERFATVAATAPTKENQTHCLNLVKIEPGDAGRDREGGSG
jgi:hypothetical protein